MPEPHDNCAKPRLRSDASPHYGPGPDFLDVRETFEESGALRIALIGEIDLASVDVVRRRLRSVHRTAAPVVLDLSAVSFIDCAGLRAILEELETAKRAGSRLQLVFEDSASFKRLLRLIRTAGVADQLPAAWLTGLGSLVDDDARAQ